MSGQVLRELIMKKNILLALGLISICSLSNAESLYEIQGRWIEGGLLFGNTVPGAELVFKGEPVVVAEDGLFVIGLHRDEDETVSLEVTLPNGQNLIETFQIEQREYRIQRIEGIKREIMEPTKEDQDRIWAEVQQTRKARAVQSSRRDFLADFQWPLTGPITGVYGSQRVYNGVPGTPHYGLDIAAPTGTPVVAPAPGVVTLVHDNMFYSGGTLMVDHGHGVSSTFIHLSKVLVEEGQELKVGDVIAEVGATGRVTGPHLDWRMNWKNARIDPEFLVPDMSEAIEKK